MSRMTFPLCLSFFLLATPSFAIQGKDPDAQAKAVLLQFLQARQAKNLDALMKTVDVPWYHDGKSVMTDLKEVEAEFRSLILRKNQPQVEFEVKHLVPYRVMVSLFKEHERRMTDQVLSPEDRVAIIAVRTVGSNKEEKLLLFIRLRDGQAKMAGIMN
jgi:hypothetical protein